MPRQYDTIKRVNTHVNDLCRNFSDYLGIFENENHFNEGTYRGSLRAYTKHIELIGSQDTTRDIIASDECLRSAYSMLKKFGMGTRGSELVSQNEFINRIRKNTESIASFDNMSIQDVEPQDISNLWKIIRIIGIAKNKSQIVAASKALHFLMPRLMPPIDREYTRRFFSYQQIQFQDNEPVFKFIMPYFVRIAQKNDLTPYIDRSSWAVSVAKLIDNAIIGFGKEHGRHWPKVPECCSSALSLWQPNYQ